MNSSRNKLIGIFADRSQFSTKLLEDLGPFMMDFTDIHPTPNEGNDIHENSLRLFTLWVEETDSKKVCLIVRGFYILIPIDLNFVNHYYRATNNVTFYPMAVLSSFRTNYKDIQDIDDLIDQFQIEINYNWNHLRNKAISQLKKGSEMWKRYILSMEKIVNFTIMSPSMDRELIEALRRKNYRTTGVLQLLSSPDISFEQVVIEEHMKNAIKIINQSKL